MEQGRRKTPFLQIVLHVESFLKEFKDLQWILEELEYELHSKLHPETCP